MTVTPDSIASLVLQHFDRLPTKRKPLVRDNGVHEWVPLSAIVAQGKKIFPCTFYYSQNPAQQSIVPFLSVFSPDELWANAPNQKKMTSSRASPWPQA
jgi:hypothetical protein